MGCGCKNKGNQTQTTNTNTTNTTQNTQQVQKITEDIKTSIKKTIEKYYNKTR